MRMQFGNVGRILGLTFILLTVVTVGRAQSVVFSGDFSNMTVGTVRPIVAVGNGGSWNFPDSITVGACNAENTSCWDEPNGLGFSLNSSGPFSYLLQNVSLPLDYLGNGTTQTIYMKALTATPAVHVVGCTGTLFCATTTNLSIAGTTPTPTPNPNPAPSVTAVGVGDIVPYWLVTPAPVAADYRNQTVHFTIQPNDLVGAANSMTSATWGAAIGVDMVIDSAGNGKTSTFYVKGRKGTISPVSFSASSANHFAVASQTRYMTVAQITYLTWIQYSSSHPLDANPLAGGGGRIYADKYYANESGNTEAWRMVGIRAQIRPAIAGMNVRVKVFDVDDPSGNSSPLDPNGNVGNDNREFTYGLTGNLTTNSSGAATIYYKVSTRPGDNYRVAATVSSQPLATTHPLRQKFDAVTTDILDGTMLASIGYSGTIPEYSPSTPFVTSEAIVATPLLTVWRRLHIERDSMGAVARNNSLRGSFSGVVARGPTYESTLKLEASHINLELNRFQRGRLVLRESHGAAPVNYEVIENDSRSITITPAIPSAFSFSADSFELYDDDDFDGYGFFDPNHPPYPNGDEGEDIPAPDTGLLQDSDDPVKNVLAPAYIRPKYDLAGDEDDVPFRLNTDGDTTHFDNLADEANPDFWVIYLLHAYQSNVTVDCDPDPPLDGPCSSANWLGDAGAVFWAENFTDRESQRIRTPGWPMPSFTIRKREVAFMVGGLFATSYGDGDIMNGINCSSNCLQFSNTSLAKIRDALNP